MRWKEIEDEGVQRDTYGGDVCLALSLENLKGLKIQVLWAHAFNEQSSFPWKLSLGTTSDENALLIFMPGIPQVEKDRSQGVHIETHPVRLVFYFLPVSLSVLLVIHQVSNTASFRLCRWQESVEPSSRRMMLTILITMYIFRQILLAEREKIHGT